MTRMGLVLVGIGLAAVGGCPTTPGLEFIPGSEGDARRLGNTSSVQVFSPAANLAITGGTPVEVAWNAVATTNFASIDVFFDVDQNPNNDNELFAEVGLDLTAETALVNTSDLETGQYFVGVRLNERNELSAFDYSPGQLIINQMPDFFFSSPNSNFTFDRTERIVPRFDVAWTVRDPDSTISVRIFLDPDQTPNGNEFLLRESTSQTGDSFTFNLPTGGFDAGTYRLLAIVSDGVEETAFYAPGAIRLLNRLAGYVDLRNIDQPVENSSLHGAVFEGFNPRDNLGSFVASARDVDGDGLGDIMMVSQFGKPNAVFNAERTGVGEAYLVYGRNARFSGAQSVNSVGRLFRGDIFTGPPEAADPIRPSRGISSFTVLSDWDRDTVRDFAFGAPFTDSLPTAATLGLDASGSFRTGAVVVAAGSCLRPDFGFPGGSVINLADVGVEPHSTIKENPACPEGYYGPKAPGSGAGGGVTSYWWHIVDIPAGVPADRLGCRFTTNDFDDQFGETISAYDFDGIIVSAPNRDPSVATTAASTPGGGVVSVYFMPKFAPFYPWTNVQAPPANGTLGYPGTPDHPSFDLLPHRGPYTYIFDDIRPFVGPLGVTLPGSPGYTVDDEDGEPCEIESAGGALPTAANTARFYSSTPGGRLSNAKGSDDFNADGLFDILVGHPLANEGAGACYVILGRLVALMTGGELEIEELSLPLGSGQGQNSRIFDGVRVVGSPGERLGQAQDAAGDFNGDGIPDVIIGSPLLNNRRGGAAIFFGSREVINLTQTDIPFNELPARGLGVIFVGEAEGDFSGARVAGAGDVDGDGLDDILIAAPNQSVRLDVDQDGILDIDRTECGVVYMVYGSSNIRGTLNLADVGTERLPGAVFVGRNSGDRLGAGLGEQGDRSNGIAGAGDVDGDGRRDLLLGSVSASPRNRVAAGEVYLIYGQGD